MMRPSRTSRSWAVGGRLTRPILAYLVIVTLGAWVFGAGQLVQQGGHLVPALAEAAGTIWVALIWLAFILLIPAMVVTIELVHRREAASRVARAMVGAVAWAGWGLIVAVTLALASRVGMVLGWVAEDLVLFAAGGAVYGLLAFDGEAPRPGRGLTLVALIVVAAVVLGSIWMAGRWGGPV